MAYSEKSSITTKTRATSGRSPGTKPMSALVWSAPACGDVMKLQIKVGANGVIEDAKFKTYGCGSAIASSSLVTEWVKGKTLDEAMNPEEHPDRRGTGAAAGEDSLLDPRRGRNQGGGAGLQGEAHRGECGEGSRVTVEVAGQVGMAIRRAFQPAAFKLLRGRPVAHPYGAGKCQSPAPAAANHVQKHPRQARSRASAFASV